MSDISVLRLLLPECLPQSYDELCGRRSEHASEALRLSLSISSDVSDAETLDSLRAALSALPAAGQAVCSECDNKLRANCDSHDEYCRIERITGESSVEIFMRSILSAYEELMAEVTSGGTTLSDQQLHELRGAFDKMLRFINGDLNTELASVSQRAEKRCAELGPGCDPLGRWIRGHHVFLVLIQCLITAMNCFQDACRAGESEQSARALDLATMLFGGCSAALHFAGDFHSDDYEHTVRPTMSPPQAPPGMSGVLARDHEHLVRLLQSQKEVFAGLEPEMKERYGKFVSAFAHTYEAHKLVCSKFVGDEVPSLLSQGEQAAVDVLEKVKAARLRSFN